ncbi:hypothetical protein GHT06_020796 [Daphnia sinensis]|uniref:Uncharacterized protein n=1 Tax=Daphnia sinensis TaxID=1820382 RepID=A0AAD5KI76_9CRUS|nr:hypothetical protein GHT06_020796 [Daphnia sinensis]
MSSVAVPSGLLDECRKKNKMTGKKEKGKKRRIEEKGERMREGNKLRACHVTTLHSISNGSAQPDDDDILEFSQHGDDATLFHLAIAANSVLAI